jgi:hypothetical protein
MNYQPSQHAKTNELDRLIFANRKLDALQLLRDRRGISLAEATATLTVRYQQLRADFSDQFTCDDAEYWRGFHS